MNVHVDDIDGSTPSTADPERSLGHIQVRQLRALRDVGLEGLTPHELRRAAASLAFAARAGVNPGQRMLGQASVA